VGHTIKNGQVVDIEDSGSAGNQYDFGGVTGSIDEDTLDIDKATENEIKVTTKNLTNSVDSGLVQSQSATSNAEKTLVSATGDWVKIEKNGPVVHVKSPVESDSDPEVWATDVISLDGGGTVTYTFDNKGHLALRDASAAPDGTVNTRYTHCTNPSIDDLIFSSDQGAVILSGGECYDRDTTTTAAITSPTPTVTDTYADCSTCDSSNVKYEYLWCDGAGSHVIAGDVGFVVTLDGECYQRFDAIDAPLSDPQPAVAGDYSDCTDCLGDATNVKLQDCTDSSAFYYVSTDTPNYVATDGAFWGCVSGNYKKLLNLGVNSTLASTVTAIKRQPCGGSAPGGGAISCAELIGMPWSDSFATIACDSNSIGDANWLAKGMLITNQTFANFTQNITAGNLVLAGSATSAGTKQMFVSNTSVSIAASEEFRCGVNLTSITSPVGDEFRFNFWDLVLGGTVMRISVDVNPTGVESNSVSFGTQVIDLNGIVSYPVSSFEFRRDSGGTIRAYIDGVLRGTSTSTHSGALSLAKFWAGLNNAGGPNRSIDMKIGNIWYQDGPGNDLVNDPTGDAC